MKEEIIKAIGKIEIYFEHTFEGSKTSTSECYCEFDNDNFIVNFTLKEVVNYVSSVDYPEFQDMFVEDFEIHDPNGNEIDIDITDEEIIESLNY